MKESLQPKAGDHYLLFSKFPFDFCTKLPLEIALGVYLAETPHHVFSQVTKSEDTRCLADYLLPGYSLGGGVPNSCFYTTSENTSIPGPPVPDRFFVVVNALRLYLPLDIRVASCFTLCDAPLYIDGKIIYRYQTRPTFCVQGDRAYSADDLEKAGDVCIKLDELREICGGRFASGVLFFNQASSGMSSSFQLAYLGLFASLEALFAPKGNKAQTLAKRVSRFLQDWEFGVDLATWLKEEYVKERSDLAHGVQDVVPWPALQPENEKRFRILHEVARLAILGIMGLNQNTIHTLSNATGTSLQNCIRGLPTASGPFLANQRVWP